MQNIENEIWGILNLEEFNILNMKLQEKYGKPKEIKKLVFDFSDFADEKIDTRIKISKNSVKIVQKIGYLNEQNISSKEELEIPITISIETIKNYINVLKNINRNPTTPHFVMQYIDFKWNIFYKENHLNIKLSKQFGKLERYNLEIEGDSIVSIQEFIEEFGIKADFNKKDSTFWDDWNKNVNLRLSELDESRIENLILEYI